MVDFKNGVLFKLKQDSKAKDQAVADLLVPGEQVLGSYTAIRDYVVFTDKRIICVNVQGITGKKKDYTSLPYSQITVFSVETAGVLDLDSELEMYFAGLGKVHFDFSGGCDIKAIGQSIASYVLAK